MTSISHPRPSDVLAAFVAGAGSVPLPEATRHAARRALLDAIGVSLAATRLGEGCAAFAKLARNQGGTAESTLMGGAGMKVPALMAAFANGSLAHAMDFEDAHDGALVHPNAATIPAALAVAEAIGADGRRTLTAIVAGCEIVCRLGLALRAPLDDFGWYPPPILGAFGATAAAASLYGLSPKQVRDAFSLTLCQATCSAELKHSPESVIRAVRDAFAAKAGVLSAQLARDGVTGFERPFEGEAGFFAAFARGHYEPAVLTDHPDEALEIERLSFKPWPSCRGTHAAIEGALALVREHGIRPDEITEVRVTGHRLNRMLAEPRQSKCRPATAIDARFSIPFTVATALVHTDVMLEHFMPGALADPAVLDLARRVHYEAADDDGESVAMTSGTTTIHTRDGREHSHAVVTPLGHPDHPLDDAALEAKFHRCAAAGGIERDRAERIAGTVASLEQAAHLRELTDLL